MNIQPSKSLLRLWALANAEAWFCQSDSIEPVHFWIACLKLADPAIAAAMLNQGTPPEECAEQAAAAREILTYLEIDTAKATSLRRGLRGKVLRGREPRSFPEGGPPYLHRSESSRRLFEIALRKAHERQSAELTPLILLESLFDMKLASLESL